MDIEFARVKIFTLKEYRQLSRLEKLAIDFIGKFRRF